MLFRSASAAVDVASLREKVAALELNITEEAGAKKQTESLLADLSRRIEELRPFAALGLSLERYRGYESIVVIVGRLARGAPQFREKFPNAEVFEADGSIA